MTVRYALIALATATLGSFPAAAEATERWQPAAGDVIQFSVLREGKPFGSHTVRFDKDASGRLIATTDVSLRAGLGPIPLFRYNLEATETWSGEELLSVQGAVNEDGNKRKVSAVRQGGALQVKGSDFTGAAPKGVIPASHWNFAQATASKLLSTEDGEILDVDVTKVGRETVKAGEANVAATHYRLDSAIDVDLWYDDAGRWVKLAFKARGQDIEYVLDTLY